MDIWSGLEYAGRAGLQEYGVKQQLYFVISMMGTICLSNGATVAAVLRLRLTATITCCKNDIPTMMTNMCPICFGGPTLNKGQFTVKAWQL